MAAEVGVVGRYGVNLRLADARVADKHDLTSVSMLRCEAEECMRVYALGVCDGRGGWMRTLKR